MLYYFYRRRLDFRKETNYMEIGDRLRYLRKELLKMTLEDFGGKLGLKKSTLSNIENGTYNLTEQTRRSIMREFGVNEQWILSGEGEPFKEKTLSEEIKDFMNDLDYDDSFKAKLIALLVRMTPDEWEMLEKMARKLGKLDQSTELEGKSTEELEEIYKKEVLSSPSEPGATA